MNIGWGGFESAWGFLLFLFFAGLMFILFAEQLNE